MATNVLERHEIIIGYHGFKKVCFICSNDPHYFLKCGSNEPKPIFLTIIKCKKDALGEGMVPYYYCQSCASAELKRMREKIDNFFVPNSGLSMNTKESAEWECHWRESEEEKKLKPSSKIWKGK